MYFVFCILYLVFGIYRRHMKYVGKARVMSVKKFCEERSGIEILAKNESLAISIFIRRDFPCPVASFALLLGFCNFSYPRKKS